MKNVSLSKLIGEEEYKIIKEIYNGKSIFGLWKELEYINFCIDKILELDAVLYSKEFFDFIKESLVVCYLIKKKSYKEKHKLIKKLEKLEEKAFENYDFETAKKYNSQKNYFRKFFF